MHALHSLRRSRNLPTLAASRQAMVDTHASRYSVRRCQRPTLFSQHVPCFVYILTYEANSVASLREKSLMMNTLVYILIARTDVLNTMPMPVIQDPAILPFLAGSSKSTIYPSGGGSIVRTPFVIDISADYLVGRLCFESIRNAPQGNQRVSWQRRLSKTQVRCRPEELKYIISSLILWTTFPYSR